MKKIVIEIICLLFIALFIYAAVSKLLEFEKFRIQIGQSPLLTHIGTWIAWIIPSIEILISLLLVTIKFRLVALYAAFTLMVIFTGYIVAILNFSENIPCSCGGVLDQLGWKEHLYFNIGFLILGLIAILLESKHHINQVAVS